jgi:hypothetical protein
MLESGLSSRTRLPIYEVSGQVCYIYGGLELLPLLGVAISTRVCSYRILSVADLLFYFWKFGDFSRDSHRYDLLSIRWVLRCSLYLGMCMVRPRNLTYVARVNDNHSMHLTPTNIQNYSQ